MPEMVVYGCGAGPTLYGGDLKIDVAPCGPVMNWPVTSLLRGDGGSANSCSGRGPVAVSLGGLREGQRAQLSGRQDGPGEVRTGYSKVLRREAEEAGKCSLWSPTERRW